MLKVNLKVIGAGKHEGQLVPLTSSKFLIGRETDCHLRPNSEMVSRHHCAISVDDFAVRLRDLGSTNGTLVNGERIRGVVQLNAGDRVTVGKLEFEILIGSEELPRAGASAGASALQGETAELATDETHYEMPTFQFEPEPETEPVSANQTMRISAEELGSLAPATAPAVAPAQQPPAQAAAAAQQPPAPPQPQAMPGYQYPGQYPPPGYPYGMGFPGPMPGYYPQYPQYPQYPYPQPVVMGQPYPGYPQQQPQSEPPAASSADDSDILDVRLPDPKTTGLQAANAPVTTGNGPAAPPPPPTSKNPSEHAADIIRQHLQRRPGIEDK
jgi:predicted component of type VI protein secretion system